ncbi:hypothetical protein AURDEDRAFT_160266 [Auricularia subglabra TFB-10046 SS5]|nr:hypothetical protein AURDEDRAFT_160266 [Auricularia subglabra TFB-10046 SS5]
MAARRPSHSVYGWDTPVAASGSGLARSASYPGTPLLRTIPLPPATHDMQTSTHWLLSGGVMAYNVSHPPHYAQIPTQRGHVGISAGQLELPATVPSWRRAIVHFCDCPSEWEVAIEPDGGGEVLTVRDVLAALWRALAVETTVDVPTPLGTQRRRVRRLDLLRGRQHLLDVRASHDGRLLVRLC